MDEIKAGDIYKYKNEAFTYLILSKHGKSELLFSALVLNNNTGGVYVSIGKTTFVSIISIINNSVKIS